MLDPGLLREQMDVLRAALSRRGLKADAELEQLATLEARRRRLIPELEGLKREQNAAGDEVARAKRQGLDASSIFAANKARGQRIRQLEIETDQVEQQRTALLMTLPNIPMPRYPKASARRRTSRCAGTASLERSISRQSRIGSSARHSALSTSSARPACQVRVSRC